MREAGRETWVRERERERCVRQGERDMRERRRAISAITEWESSGLREGLR
jgi:hypothetical protein